MRRFALLSVLIATPTLAPAVLADAVTTRIETRPYYGAIVTIEQGVRVWRALPPHDRIIIVPENAKNVKVNVNVGDHTPALQPVTVNSNVRINQSTHDGGVGIPYSHSYSRGGYGHGRGHGYGIPAPLRRH